MPARTRLLLGLLLVMNGKEYALCAVSNVFPHVNIFDLGSVYDEDDKLIPQAKPYSRDTGIMKKNHCLSIMVRRSLTRTLSV